MKASSPPPSALLSAPSFVIAVFLLALNDHLLKAAIGSWWTGKLSDVAGLFAFPIFWSSLLPQRRRIVFVATAVGFLIWKSPLSASPLASWNTLGIMPLSRIVDYSDWLALVALIPAYSVVRRRSARETLRAPRTLHRLGAIGVSVFALLTFTATSAAPRLYAVPTHEGYDVAASRGAIRAHLDTLSSSGGDLPVSLAAPSCRVGRYAEHQWR